MSTKRSKTLSRAYSTDSDSDVQQIRPVKKSKAEPTDTIETGSGNVEMPQVAPPSDDIQLENSPEPDVGLPPEIWDQIIAQCDIATILKCRLISKEFREKAEYVLQNIVPNRFALQRIQHAQRLLIDLSCKIHHFKLTNPQPSHPVDTYSATPPTSPLRSQMSSPMTSPVRSQPMSTPRKPFSPNRFAPFSPSSQMSVDSDISFTQEEALELYEPELGPDNAEEERQIQIESLVNALLRTLGHDDPQRIQAVASVAVSQGFSQSSSRLQLGQHTKALLLDLFNMIPQKIMKHNFGHIMSYCNFFKNFVPQFETPKLYSILSKWCDDAGFGPEFELLTKHLPSHGFSDMARACRKNPFSVLVLIILLILPNPEHIENLTTTIIQTTNITKLQMEEFLSCLDLILIKESKIIDTLLGLDRPEDQMLESESEDEEVNSARPVNSVIRIMNDLEMAMTRLRNYGSCRQYRLTSEQQLIVDTKVCRPGQILFIQAFAGTGKTTTLYEFAKAHPESQMMYLTFSKDLEQSGKEKFGHLGNVHCQTFHSLAWRHAETLGYNRDLMGFEAVDPAVVGQLFQCSRSVAKYILLTVASFVTRTFDRISKYDIPWQAIKNRERLIKKQNDTGKPPTSRSNWTVHHFWMEDDEYVACAEKVWSMMKDKTNKQYKLTPDGQLRLAWETNMAILGREYILFDEVQDASMVMIDVLRRQRRAKVIVVGDRHQRIYGFRKAVKCLTATLRAENTLVLSRSFRFDVAIAQVANMVVGIVKGEPVPIIGSSVSSEIYYSIPIRQLPDHGKWTFVFRTNHGIMTKAMELMKVHPTLKVAALVKNGSLKRLVNLVREIWNLKHLGQRSRYQELRDFKSYNDLISSLEDDYDADMAMANDVMCAFELSGGNVIQQAEKMRDSLLEVSPEEADFILTTTHKSKGLEWDNVALGDDFMSLSENWKATVAERVDPEVIPRMDELNCIYVAATRAKKKLLLNPDMAKWLATTLGCDRFILSNPGMEIPVDGKGAFLANFSRRMENYKIVKLGKGPKNDHVVGWVKDFLLARQ